MKNTLILLYMVFTIALLLAGGVMGVRADSTVNFHGSLLDMNCSINGGITQAVDFGNAVGIHRINGTRYKQAVPFLVECTNTGDEIPEMTLMIEGAATSFDNAAVTTDVTGLGIELQINGVAQPLNKKVNFDVNSLPTLSAVPVLQPGIEPAADDFHATVKLIVGIA